MTQPLTAVPLVVSLVALWVSVGNCEHALALRERWGLSWRDVGPQLAAGGVCVAFSVGSTVYSLTALK